MRGSSPSISFSDYSSSEVSPDLLRRCATLFSTHYGIWSDQGLRPGQSVIMTADKLKSLMLFDQDKCCLAVARTSDGSVVGQAFYCEFIYEPVNQQVVWITQLVVTPEYRRQHVATNLVQSACAKKSLFACGLVSCNPLAVLALYSALGKQHHHDLIVKHAYSIAQASGVPYIRGKQVRITQSATSCSSVMLTDFHVCHPSFIMSDICDNWQLGTLNPGDEFLAMVFHV